jgi:hypothetical protein
VEFLTSLGVSTQFACMMASKAPGILARTPEQLQAVADFVKSRGFEGAYAEGRCLGLAKPQI